MKNLVIGLALGAAVAGFLGHRQGLATGNAAAEAKLTATRFEGRMSACQEIFSVIAPMFPVPLECSEYQGDVVITSPAAPGVRSALNGDKIE